MSAPEDYIPIDEAAIIRCARKAHICVGPHNGQKRVRCGAGPIAKGSVYVEWMDSAACYQSGERYHWWCAITQGILKPRES